MKKAWFGVLVLVVIVALVFSYVSLVAVNKTSEPQFCMRCHTMKSAVESFYISVHGGNNAYGFKSAHCTDCHLPHKSTFGYLVAKGVTGTRDFLAEVGLKGKIDLKKALWERERYVYDSGCLKCHQDMNHPDKAYSMDSDVRKIHLYYWKTKEAGVDISCVDCHNDYTTPGFAHPEIYAMFK